MVDDCDLPLDLELTEQIDVNDKTLPYDEENWNNPEQTETEKSVQCSFPLTMETTMSKKRRNKMKYNPYSESFVVDRIVLDNVTTQKWV